MPASSSVNDDMRRPSEAMPSTRNSTSAAPRKEHSTTGDPRPLRAAQTRWRSPRPARRRSRSPAYRAWPAHRAAGPERARPRRPTLPRQHGQQHPRNPRIEEDLVVGRLSGQSASVRDGGRTDQWRHAQHHRRHRGRDRDGQPEALLPIDHPGLAAGPRSIHASTPEDPGGWSRFRALPRASRRPPPVRHPKPRCARRNSRPGSNRESRRHQQSLAAQLAQQLVDGHLVLQIEKRGGSSSSSVRGCCATAEPGFTRWRSLRSASGNRARETPACRSPAWPAPPRSNPRAIRTGRRSAAWRPIRTTCSA